MEFKLNKLVCFPLNLTKCKELTWALQDYTFNQLHISKFCKSLTFIELMIPSTLVSIVLFLKFVVVKDFMPSPESPNLYSPKP